ncbi:MAG TPA: helix-turn-helix transcriptional regulator [Candidatus Limnocylindrales bacterium]|nr:helix-turn-helix transcriptional regulator [Candidatus Limnocylindrales bacterium]
MTDARGISRTSLRTTNGRRTRSVTALAMSDIDRLRLDAGIGIRALSRAADIDEGYLSRLFAGARTPGIGVLVALTSALGAELSIKAFPGGGPSIRDGIQARIVEALLQIAAPRWRRSVEVQVLRPARGFIDAVFDDPVRPLAIAAEVHSRIDRLEQQLRWAQDKAQSLPSSNVWRFIDGDPEISRLLVLRSTAAARDLARRFGATLTAAYPSAASDAYAALTSDAAWPGASILWASVTGDAVRILDRPPRGVSVGR